MSDTAQAESGGPTEQEDKETDSFECNICLDTARDAVISLCGHLFCWPCLHKWFEVRGDGAVCPVCKAGISRDNVIPVYGRGGSREDPRIKTPPRPPGQRPAPEQPQNQQGGLGFGEGFSLSFGIGAFPYGFLATTLGGHGLQGMGGAGPANPQQNGQNGAPIAQNREEKFLSQVFAWFAVLFVFWILFA